MKKQVEFKNIYQFYHENGRVFLKGKVVIFNLYYLKEEAKIGSSLLSSENSMTG